MGQVWRSEDAKSEFELTTKEKHQITLKCLQMTYLKHWLARGLCLILIPFCVYAMSFKLHFLILNRSGPGDAQMSSLFQAHLRGNDFAESPLEVAIGSKITVKNYGYGGGLLHSHVQTYPVGSNQQQVTCYHYKDDNNNFIVSPTWDEPAYDPEAPLKFLQDGSVIRLVHASTGRNLHSHAVAAPMTKNHYEVAGYGNASIGDSNDHWIVEVVDDMHKGSKDHVERIHALTTRMRFKHATLNCYLRAANVPLPQWGFKQIEVTCDKENNPKDVHTYWNIESHWNDRCKLACTSLADVERYLISAQYSAEGQRSALQVTLLERLLASQRGHDDLEQRSGPRPRQGRYSGVGSTRLAIPPSRSTNVRMG